MVAEELGASDTVEKNGKIICKSVNIIIDTNGETVYRHVSDYRYRTPVEKLIGLL